MNKGEDCKALEQMDCLRILGLEQLSCVDDRALYYIDKRW